jgi:hypothetical protein
LRWQAGTINSGAKVIRHSGYSAFQMADAAISLNLLADILPLIVELRLLAARLTI